MMQLDHVAYLVRDADQALAALRPFAPRVVLDRHPLPSQKAYITMVEMSGGGPRTELVEPFPENRTMRARLDREGVDSLLYHSGYVVTDFDGQFRSLRAGGWLPLTKPFEGLSPGCRASHLYHPGFGIVEIMEATA